MRKRMTLALATAGAAVMVAAGAVSVAAQSTSTHQPGAPTRTAAAGPGAGGGTTVTLPTGDRVSVRSAGDGRDIVTPADLKAGPYLTERLNGDDYVVPLRALRQQGAAFDLARFDVSALLRGESTAPPVAHPDFPMRTVSLNVLNDHGDPVDYAFVTVINVDDSRKYRGGVEAVNGVARISVPDGHYSAMVEYDYYLGAGGRPSGLRMGFAEFTVAGAATAVTLDVLRTATNEVSVDAPPKAADPVEKELAYYRGSDDRSSTSLTITAEPDFSFSLGSSPTPTAGVQHLAVHERWESPAGVADPYAYDVIFPSDEAISADQHYKIDTRRLVTLDNRYHSDQAGREAMADTAPLLSWQSLGSGLLSEVPQPGHKIEYVTAHPEVAYWGYLGVDGESGPWESGLHQYRPGQHVTIDWMRGPVVPGFPADTGVGDYPCWACRTGDTLALFVNPLSDSEPDHLDPAAWFDRYVPADTHFQLYQGDTKLADLTGANGGTFTVGPEPAAYRVVYDQTRPGVGHSTSSHAEWTFHSQHSGTTTVPDRFGCDTNGGRTNCSAVSLLTLNYALPQGLDETVAAGRQCMELTVGHTAGTPAVAVRSATVAYSLDGGATWTPATAVDQGHGRFGVTWNLPASAAGKKVSFAVTAADAAGDTVRQTVTDAVTVS